MQAGFVRGKGTNGLHRVYAGRKWLSTAGVSDSRAPAFGRGPQGGQAAEFGLPIFSFGREEDRTMRHGRFREFAPCDRCAEATRSRPYCCAPCSHRDRPPVQRRGQVFRNADVSLRAERECRSPRRQALPGIRASPRLPHSRLRRIPLWGSTMLRDLDCARRIRLDEREARSNQQRHRGTSKCLRS